MAPPLDEEYAATVDEETTEAHLAPEEVSIANLAAQSSSEAAMVTVGPQGPSAPGPQGPAGPAGPAGPQGNRGVGIRSIDNPEGLPFASIAYDDNTFALLPLPVGPAGEDGTDGTNGTNGADGASGVVTNPHGTNANAARIPGSINHWIGTATPTNALPTDFWTRRNI